MRMVVISQTGFGLGIASHLSSEGHSIDTIVSGTGEIPRIQGMFRDSIPDIAILDSPVHTDIAEWIRTRGVKVLGDSKWSRLLTTNIEYRRDLMKAIGYPMADYKTEGVPVIVSCWFNGHRFISKMLVFNYIKMMSGDVGVNVPSAGYVAYFDVEKSRLVNEVLKPLEKFLRKANHRGCFSVEVIVDDKGKWWVNDMSPSINQPFIQAVFENTKRSKSDVLLDLFNESSEPIPYLEPYVCGCMVSVYPYPYTRPMTPLEIGGINSFNLKHMWIMDCTSQADLWTCGSMSGCMGYVTARGSTVQESKRRVYRTISNIHIDGMQYRNDIGKDVGPKMHTLKVKKLI